MWRRRLFILAGLFCLSAASFAELSHWVQNMEASDPRRVAFIRIVNMPGGMMPLRRPPAETRPALGQLIAAAPTNADLVALRAREDELQLDFTAAEEDWKKYATLAKDPAEGQTALADFYHRRLRPQDEVQALTLAAQAPAPATERLTLVAEQRSWLAFQRVFALIGAHALPSTLAVAEYKAWMARYPREAQVQTGYFYYLLDHKDFAAAEQAIPGYQKAFRQDQVFPVQARAALALRRGSQAAALDIYDKAFQPSWPPALVKSYFQLLSETRRLRDFLARTRTALNAAPESLEPAARLFYYYQQAGNLPAAQRALVEFRLRKEARKSAWKAAELLQMARLFEAAQDSNEAARAYYALYSLEPSVPANAEAALTGICGVLLNAPDRNIPFGAGDLSFYRDIGTMDPYPGYLNGILSLLLNTNTPQGPYAMAEQASVAYFHRARAAELLSLLDTRFPNSRQRSSLHARLVEAYAAYGANDGVIAAGGRFLTAFPKAGERTRVALLVAEAHARKNQVTQEFAVYDALLKELAENASGVPIGDRQGPPPPVVDGIQTQAVPGLGARSPEYARVLDRYLSRLVVLKRLTDALALYRREIDRNPQDPGLYERLATFLDQNRRAAEVADVYRKAMQQFPDKSWHHKLARWYLRQRQQAEFERLTREVTGAFSGSDLETYFRQVVAQGNIDPVMYRQVNLYAHDRFPQNLTFVRNLLAAYQRQETYDRAAWEKLLRENWFYDDLLRSRFFEFLSSSGRLDAELRAARAIQQANPGVEQFSGEAEVWQSHFEAAVAPLSALAKEFPGSPDLVRRVAAIDRSLVPFDPAKTDVAATLEESLNRLAPRDRATLARLGEVYADREMFLKARPYWDKIAAIEPGSADGYLEAATVFWDYYQFDDSLRWMAEGRKNLANPALYSYEAGAVYENRREYARAVAEYVKGAAENEGGSPARGRLLELAKRPEHRAIIEDATIKQAEGANPSLAAFSLRQQVLETQSRRDDLEKFLLAVVNGTSSMELLARCDSVAGLQGMEAVRRRALERQIAVSRDPVETMSLRLALVRYLESKGETAAARTAIEALYKENPAILGVVRATVDFYWRNKMSQAAVNLLGEAPNIANPQPKKQFTFEAVRKSTEAGQYQAARDRLAPLLKDDPFNAEYLAAQADTYARSGDDRALRDFYNTTLQALRDAPLSSDDRISRAAGMRRGLIPALTRLKDFTGAVDQYIELINRYPQDEGLLQEAARYAAANNLRPRLLDYYVKTAAASPRDYRWPMVIARVNTSFEDYPAAIASYGKAIEVRPDLTSLYESRAALAERLMRFDEALRDYQKLYELTYRNPIWMEKTAETQARLGKTDLAVEALRKALIEGRPERPQLYFTAAERLEGWSMLGPARQMAEKGIDLAGANLLLPTGGEFHGAMVYARIMTRLRQHEAAYARLVAASNSAPVLGGLFREMGTTVKRYFTPEETAAFASFLEKERPDNDRLELAASAGLADLQARWCYELMMARPGQPSANYLAQLQSVQSLRMRYAELGSQLEAYWKVYPRNQGNDLLSRAASAYRSAGDEAAELRVLAQTQQTPRYLELVLKSEPETLVTISGSNRAPALRNDAAAAAVASGNVDLARRAIAARGRGLPPVWSKAYAGLVGLYYSDASPEVKAAFLAALGGGTIGERLGTRVDRNAQMAGDIWFYYGSRYGEYMDLVKSAAAEEFLPAMLEATPGRSEAYFQTGEYYRERRNFATALTNYQLASDLAPTRADTHVRMAEILREQGKSDESIAQWRAALVAFRQIQDRGGIPPSFWTDVSAALESIGKNQLFATLREDADRLLRTYVRRNGVYMVDPLLKGALAAGGVPWIVELSAAAPDPVGFLGLVANAQWLPDAGREVVLRRVIELARDRVAQSHGQDREMAQGTVNDWQMQWINFLLKTKQNAKAPAALDAWKAELDESTRRNLMTQIAPLEIRVAAQTGRLDALIETYRASRPSENFASGFDFLLSIAADLRKTGDAASARKLLDFAYTRALDQQFLAAANFLGLAEVRLETGDVAGAVALLRRMTLVAGAPFENLAAAGELLEKSGRTSEAAEFWAARMRSTPWDLDARVHRSGAEVAAVAATTEATYATRVAAAQALGRARIRATNLGSAELALLSEGAVAPAASEQPFFVAARLAAVERTTDVAARLRLLLAVAALDPTNETSRPALFRAAFEAGQYAVAVSAIEQNLRAPADQEGPPEDFAGAAMFLPGIRLDPAQRAALARAYASALEKLDRLSNAERYFQIAVELDPAPEARAGLDRVKAERARRSADALRRPRVTQNLEQERLVRPRL